MAEIREEPQELNADEEVNPSDSAYDEAKIEEGDAIEGGQAVEEVEAGEGIEGNDKIDASGDPAGIDASGEGAALDDETASKGEEGVVVMAENGEEIMQGNDIDQRSVCVKNVDYASTPEDLKEHFASCGAINRVTIICDKFTGHPKGFAYVEFSETESVDTAKMLNDSLFRGRQIQVLPKRTNVPFRGRGGRRPRGRFFSRGPRMFSGGRGRFGGGRYRFRPY